MLPTCRAPSMLPGSAVALRESATLLRVPFAAAVGSEPAGLDQGGPVS